MRNLKPCPICGSPAKIFIGGFGELAPSCTDPQCGCGFDPGIWATKDSINSLVEKWNRRASDPLADALAAAMDGLLECHDKHRTQLERKGFMSPAMLCEKRGKAWYALEAYRRKRGDDPVPSKNPLFPGKRREMAVEEPDIEETEPTIVRDAAPCPNCSDRRRYIAFEEAGDKNDLILECVGCGRQDRYEGVYIEKMETTYDPKIVKVEEIPLSEEEDGETT